MFNFLLCGLLVLGVSSSFAANLRDVELGEASTSAPTRSAPSTIENVSLEELFTIAKDSQAPTQGEAIDRLMDNMHGSAFISSRKQIFSTLLQVSEDPENAHQFTALEFLWHFPMVSSDARAKIYSLLLQIAQNPADSHQWKAIESLWHYRSDGQAAETARRAQLYDTLLEIGRHPGPHQLDALTKIRNAYPNNPQSDAKIDPLFEAIARNSKDAEQRHAIYALRKSSIPASQRLGEELKQHHFPRAGYP